MLQQVATTWQTIKYSDDTWKDGLTGSAWGDWANYTASPLRAFEKELGAQVGFTSWDMNQNCGELTWHDNLTQYMTPMTPMTRDRHLWASGTHWACPLMATCTLSSAADPLSSSTVASACWNIGWTKGSGFAYTVHIWDHLSANSQVDCSCCLWTGRLRTCAECLFLLLLRQPWATSPQRLLLGEFLATPNQAEVNMSGGACLSV